MCIVTRVPCTERLRIYLAKSNRHSSGRAISSALCQPHYFFSASRELPTCFIDGHEVTEAIRQPDVTNAVSAVSKHAKVREEMVALQQKIGQAGGVVMDGRDIGTAVLPKVPK